MKKYLRAFFVDCGKILKMNYFLQKCNINSSNFSSFVSGNDNSISDDKLLELTSFILDEVNRIIYENE